MSLHAVSTFPLSTTTSSHLSLIHFYADFHTPSLTHFPSWLCLKFPTHLRGDGLVAMEVSTGLKLLGKSDKVRRLLQAPPVVEPVQRSDSSTGEGCTAAVDTNMCQWSVQGVTRLSMI